MTILATKRVEGDEEDKDQEMVEEYVIFLDEKKAKKVLDKFDNVMERMVDHIEINDEKLLIMNPDVTEAGEGGLPSLS